MSSSLAFNETSVACPPCVTETIVPAEPRIIGMGVAVPPVITRAGVVDFDVLELVLQTTGMRE